MSFWEKDMQNFSFPMLERDIEVDTLIIGGGIVGLTTLYYLKDKESVILVDASLIGCGVTKNTMGKLTFLQGAIYQDLSNNISRDVAISYLKSQKEAIRLAKEIIMKEKINADLEKVDSYIFTNKDNEIKKIKEEKKFLESQNISVYEKKLPLQISSKYSISVSDTYVFHPLKFLNGVVQILKNKEIYEHTKIIRIQKENDKYCCITDRNKKIYASKVIVACHYPFFLFPFCLPLKSHIEKSYIIARKIKENPKLSAITISNPGMSIRFYEDESGIYELCLSSSHKTSNHQNDLENFESVKKNFYIQEEDIVESWSNVDIMTDDKLPYIGEIKQNFYLATGFNTWGMTNGILAGFLLSRCILGKKMPYEDLFLLKRKNFYQFENFFSNLYGTAKSFIGSKKHKKKWYKENLIFTKKNGKSIAIYTDSSGEKYIVYTTCPHMGCSLIFNEKELTWDCPCHSSRFSIGGKYIKGPSTKGITYEE